MRKILNIILHVILIGILTVLTQVGGLVYLFSLWLNTTFKITSKLKRVLMFIGLYLIGSLLIVPLTAPFFGREKIKYSHGIRPTNYMTVLLNRNYVRPQLNKLLQGTANNLKGSGIQISYLDANFPFINKFPLLPHLSHNDGKKLDISLIYQNTEGELSIAQKSVSGYGVFEEPKLKEYNQIAKCLNKGYFQYDYPKYLTFGEINEELQFSVKGTKKLVTAILKQPKLGKLFIEPHLKKRLNLKSNKVRYHGCKAVRHDDHIHIQLK